MKYREILPTLNALTQLDQPFQTVDKSGAPITRRPKLDAAVRLKLSHNIRVLRKLSEEQMDLRNDMVRERLKEGQTELPDKSFESWSFNEEWDKHLRGEIVMPDNKSLKLWRIAYSDLNPADNHFLPTVFEPLLDVIITGADAGEPE